MDGKTQVAVAVVVVAVAVVADKSSRKLGPLSPKECIRFFSFHEK